MPDRASRSHKIFVKSIIMSVTITMETWILEEIEVVNECCGNDHKQSFEEVELRSFTYVKYIH